MQTLNELLKNASGVDQDNFERGVKTGNEAESVSIAVNNVWGARMKNGGHCSSYEKIGYHAGSVSFLLGIVSTHCPVHVYRNEYSGYRLLCN